jgi:type II secretory pathway component PulL
LDSRTLPKRSLLIAAARILQLSTNIQQPLIHQRDDELAFRANVVAIAARQLSDYLELDSTPGNLLT